MRPLRFFALTPLLVGLVSCVIIRPDGPREVADSEFSSNPGARLLDISAWCNGDEVDMEAEVQGRVTGVDVEYSLNDEVLGTRSLSPAADNMYRSSFVPGSSCSENQFSFYAWFIATNSDDEVVDERGTVF